MFSVMFFIYGSCLGSFICAAASRYATHESILFPASHCEACRTPLAYWQLIPVLSYCWLKGRCASCHAPISPQTLLMELGVGWLFTTWQSPVDTVSIGWLLLWGYAALCDGATQTFPAWVGVLNLLLMPHSWTPFTLLILGGSYTLIHWGWPRWSHPVIGDGDLEFISSYWIAFGALSTSRWLITACSLTLLHYWVRPHQRLPFIPALTLSAWFWWYLNR